MIALLNRISWALSILIWIIFTSFFWTWEEAIVVWGIFGIFIKWLFLRRSYIEERVENFALVLLKRQTHQNTPNIQTNTDFQNSQKETEEVMIANEVEEIPTEIWESVVSERHKNIALSEKPQEAEKWEIEIDSQIVVWIKNFFSENILAKIWGIFVFLWVIFLLTLVWKNIPWFWKILLWFCIWMTTYIAGTILNKKWIINESRILMWIWILINYAVILAGKYIIGDTSLDTTPIFSTWLSFIFLIANTLFAVYTALYYKSQVLLIFSFLFAYINPLLIGYGDTTPYLNVWYTMIVSIWALFLAYKRSDVVLLLWAFFFWNVLILSTPISSWNIEFSYMTK